MLAAITKYYEVRGTYKSTLSIITIFIFNRQRIGHKNIKWAKSRPNYYKGGRDYIPVDGTL